MSATKAPLDRPMDTSTHPNTPPLIEPHAVRKEQAMKSRSSVRSPGSRGVVRSLFLVFIAMLAALPLQASATASSRPRPAAAMDTRWSAIDAYVEQERQAARVPGIAIAIVQGDQIVHVRGFGEADPSGRAVTPQTPFGIGSASKSFTALAIMQLVEAGKIELDAPVQRYLPWFRVADAEASARITVRHLLHHTSGLPEGLGNIELATSRDMSDSAMEAQVRSLSTAELTQPVGATWQYSNVGYLMLGLLVRTVSGQSYESYMEEHVFAPLQMQHSFADPAAAREAGLSAGYRYWFGRPVAFDAPFNRAILPAGLLMTSGEDMARYLIAQLNDGRYGSTTILSPAGIAEMQRGAVPVLNGVWGGIEEARYGLGWGAGKRNGITVVEHAGRSATFRADMILVPEGRWGIAVLKNSVNRVSGERMETITDGVFNLVMGQQPPPVPENNGMLQILQLVTAVAAVQLLAMIWSAFTLRRVVRRAPGTVRGWLSIARYVVAPLAFYVPLGLFFLVLVPLLAQMPQWRLFLISIPDIATVALVSGVAALAWAIFRTAVMFRVMRRRTPLVAAPAAAPARNVQAT